MSEEWLECDQLFLSKKVILLTYTCLFSFIGLMKALTHPTDREQRRNKVPGSYVLWISCKKGSLVITFSYGKRNRP